MTVYITSVRLNASTLFSAKERAVSLVRTLESALARARSFTDPNLSDQGIAQKRAELETEFRAAATKDLDTLERDVTASRSYISGQVREAVQIPSDAAALIRAEQKWRQVERILDAGGDLQAQIRTADADTALAIAEHAPSWVAARNHRPEGLHGALADELGREAPDHAAPVRRAVYARLAEVTTDANLAELLRAEVRADTQYATAQPWLDAGRRLVEGRDANTLGAALAARVAAAEGDAPALEAATA